ncbi:hypothetical protein KF913_07750 [Candidatus Obscuribacterales bacterium]|nr:hypothetical protein [Candidatus Obscuribacterales bacterium]
MSRNPTMSEVDLRWVQLWRGVRALSEPEVEALERQLRDDSLNIDVRVHLFGYFSLYEGSELKRQDVERKLFEIVLWFTENKPAATGFLGFRLMASGRLFKPRAFGALRQAWLEQVDAFSMDGTVLGNAGMFIGWNDFETGAALIERAYELQPAENWLGLFISTVALEIWTSPELYKDRLREYIIDVGLRSLRTESGGAPSMTCQCVSNAALCLGRLDDVRTCIDHLREENHPQCDQLANVYVGLVALRESNIDCAIESLLVMKPGYEAQPVAFCLASELFDLGERESICRFIENFEGKITEHNRNRWPDQVAKDERPDFASVFPQLRRGVRSL